MNDLTTRNYPIIEGWIPAGARVLDLGCGDGSLLKSLIERKGVEGIGAERSQDMIVKCLRTGICVYQTDIDQDLSHWEDGRFDYVILNATLQEILRPRHVIEEMLRVGEHAIITVANFGYICNRLHVLLRGRVSRLIRPQGQWHDTPVIRFVSLVEFFAMLAAMSIVVVDARFVLPFNHVAPAAVPGKTLLAREGIFKLKKRRDIS